MYMFIDTAKVFIKAGDGGSGAVSFRHEIYIPKGGPDGGNGGQGGDVIFRATKDMNTLLKFRYAPELKAKDGANGAKRLCAGRSGEDLVVEVPVGTIVRDGSGKIVADLTFDGDWKIVAKGGEGGFGNAHFKSSTRQTPKIAEKGVPGEEYTGEIELKLLADVGLVGFPNAGKSTFLSVVSNARPEIANYEFTTLTPNLGVATIDQNDFLIADIPGLIEGASDGKGLGDKFLKHIERTSVLLHLIDAYSENIAEKYTAIRNELEKYSEDLIGRNEIIALTKIDGLDDEIIASQIAALREVVGVDAPVFAISSLSHTNIENLLRELLKQVRAVKLANEGSGKYALEIAEGFVDGEEMDLPVIKLEAKNSDDKWRIEKLSDKMFVVYGAKIEKFALKTDFGNFHSANRLRDILQKMGIAAELSRQGADELSEITIAGLTFLLGKQ
ncbi:MAG: GTPase ObgE [Candidatus Nomurabacteria bacterium]|jgi:GTP-binding protein|nr:GTPase ObgE [Candidatus Nomurabacteria bacterium]